MDKDIHYYGIGFLARAAGFIKEQALTIAYASQYVDDATESEPIRVGDAFFDPARSAHNGLRAYDWGVQKKIYIPFHFIPPRPFHPAEGNFTFVTERNSPFAHLLLKRASKRSTDELSRLIAIGIALHTLADSWAHHGFSGRKEAINNVETIRLFEDGYWKNPAIENVVLDVLPEIGHAEAGFYPEYPFLRWKYIRAATNESVRRNNLKDYLHAARTIHRLLSAMKKSVSAPMLPWNEIEPHIRTILAHPETNANKRCEKWRALYQATFGDTSGYLYDARQWRREALEPEDEKDIEWDHFEQRDFAQLAFSMSSNFYQTPWVKFHRAALRQRNFVLENML